MPTEYRPSTSSESTWCPATQACVGRAQCLDQPHPGFCGTCPHYSHRLRFRRRIGAEIVNCPVASGKLSDAFNRGDVSVAEAVGFSGSVITRDTCLLVKPFMHCASCPERRNK